MKKLVSEGEYAKAITLGKNIEAKHADDHDFMFIMASTYYMVDDAQNALEYFEKALSMKHDDMESLKLKTNSHLAMGQKDEAITAISRVLEIDPEDSEANALLDELQGVR